MRILIALDQHPDTLGGAQQSALLQRAALERAGHEVLFLAPGPQEGRSRDVTVDIPGVRPPGQEYRLAWPSRRGVATAARQVAARGGVDVVHVQGDYWGAVYGLGCAQRLGLPVVVTFHNNVAAGTAAVLGPAAEPVLPLLMAAASGVMRRVLGSGSARSPWDPWQYLGRIADRAQLCTTGTEHFAQALRAHGTVQDVHVVSNGIADEVLAALPAPDRPARTTFVWAGRLSAEKRPVEFLQAVQRAAAGFDVHLYGDGPLRERVEAAVRSLGLSGRVTLHGRVPYPRMIAALADAHALVQTSIGFETQGMTVFEALTVGTPVVVCDPHIAAEFAGQGIWAVPGAGRDDDGGAGRDDGGPDRGVAGGTAADAGVDALARTLEQAAADVARGAAYVALRTDFRQSAQTAAMIALYERAIRAHAAATPPL